ncbi:TonB-dependent receptor domain-containing protein [Thalassotalea marina]|uniref:TonB-dependent receptor n=1 Tax=Thalassotalea marina TaxID=1673741 RepID=A0A919EH73_9GAMM|nr:TonB-dependent receptor [Thalassotalea marina]GHF79018.1 TonB-dependent receptor [Thalassotalea marina]
MKHNLITTAVMAALSLSQPVFANQSTEVDEQITITANRTATNADDVLVSQVVITRADIEKIQAKSVLDVLATVAGIDIAANGGRGQNSSVFMRGANSDHTLVLVNGVRVGSATLGSTNLNEIAPELIERIEIVKGPRAALWGSDSIGGVVQIFTRKLDGGEHFVNATVGSEGYNKLGAGIGIDHGDGFTSVSVNREESNGFDVKDDAETDNDGFKYESLAINGQQQVSDALALTWLAQVEEGETEYDSSYQNKSDVSNYLWNIGAAYSTTVNGKANNTKVSLSQSRSSNINYGNSFKKANGSVFDTRRSQLSVVNHTELATNWQLNLGADFYDESLKGSDTFSQNQRDVSGYFAHTVYNQDALTYELAVRYDDVETVDSETTYNASVGYEFSEDTRIVVSTGTGFKAPTFNDLYYPEKWGSIGNQDLLSETSETVEINFTTLFSDVAVSFNLHQTDVDNLIKWDGAVRDDGLATPANIEEVEIQGAELGLKYPASHGTHQLNVSYIDAEDVAKNRQLARRSKNLANYKFTTEVADADLYFEWQYKGKRYDDPWGKPRLTLDSYQLINLGASYPLSDKLKIEAKINNAFNEQYQTTNNYFSQDRTVYFGVSYQN